MPHVSRISGIVARAAALSPFLVLIVHQKLHPTARRASTELCSRQSGCVRRGFCAPKRRATVAFTSAIELTAQKFASARRQGQTPKACKAMRWQYFSTLMLRHSLVAPAHRQSCVMSTQTSPFSRALTNTASRPGKIAPLVKVLIGRPAITGSDQ